MPAFIKDEFIEGNFADLDFFRVLNRPILLAVLPRGIAATARPAIYQSSPTAAPFCFVWSG